MAAEVASYSSLHCQFCGKKKKKIPLPVSWLCRVCAMHNTGRTYGLATKVHVQLLQHYFLYYLIYILYMILAKINLTTIGNLQIQFNRIKYDLCPVF